MMFIMKSGPRSVFFFIFVVFILSSSNLVEGNENSNKNSKQTSADTDTEQIHEVVDSMEPFRKGFVPPESNDNLQVKTEADVPSEQNYVSENDAELVTKSLQSQDSHPATENLKTHDGQDVVDETDDSKSANQNADQDFNTVDFTLDDAVIKGEVEEVSLDDIIEVDGAIIQMVETIDELLSEEQMYGKELYTEAMKIKYNGKEYKRFLDLIEHASSYNYTKAQEELALLLLLGDPEQTKNAISLLQNLSDIGSPVGQMGLGFLHATGIGFNSSQAKALVYYTFGALGGDSFAQMALAYKNWAHAGVPSNCEMALTYYRKVANKVAEDVSVTGGSVIQRINLAEETNNPSANPNVFDEDLLQYHKLLAEKGEVQSQVDLGQIYYQGRMGIEQDHQRAFQYFWNAAENGNANAMAFLGKIYLEGGNVVKQNNETAFNYFKRAADKNNPIGQSGLGLMYLYGKGIKKDYQKAFQYFSLAAKQRWVDGQLQLGNMFYNGLGVKKDIKMAIKYFNLASQSGHILAFYNLAQIHAAGTGVFRSCQIAVELFKNVAERGKWGSLFMDAYNNYKDGLIDQALMKYMFLAEMGYETAQSNVAFVLDKHESTSFSVNETYTRALLYYERSASQGNSESRLKLGDYHYYGYGTSVDYETSASHYKVAAEQQHNAQAMFNLGFMHEQGFGLKKDLYLAKRFYDMAAETSIDALVPVNLALMKLNFMMLMKNTEEFGWIDIFSADLVFDYILGPNWDLYLMTTLAVILSILVYFCRPQQQ